jgi:methyl-accepting chemotaxis protein
MAFGFGGGTARKSIPTRMVVIALGAVILVIGGVYSAMTLMVSHSFQDAGRSSEAMISSLRAHMTADMLHDGLRGVVFRAMYSGITYNADAVAEAKSEIAEYGGEMRAAIEAQAAALVEQTNAAIGQTESQAGELDRIVDVFTVAEVNAAPVVVEAGGARRAYLSQSNAALKAEWSAF